MVELKDLVECFLSYLTDTLTVAPLIERFFDHGALLDALHVV